MDAPPELARHHVPAEAPVDVGPAPELLHWMRLVGAGVAQARFAGFDAHDRFLVTTAAAADPCIAASTIGLAASDVGAPVVVAWENGDVRRPIVIGRLLRRDVATSARTSVSVDGDRLVLKAEREIELRCGESSIVLTRAGKVLIRGSYVLSRSRGANRIKGACVDIN